MAPARIERRGAVGVLTWPTFEDVGLHAVVTTRSGGVSAGPYRSLNLGLHVGDDPSAVIENRRRAAAALGAQLGDLVFCNQTHGRGVATVGLADRGRGATDTADALADVDALVTDRPGVGLVMMAADCTPIVLYDPEARVLGCVHSGWRGTSVRVGAAAVEAMVALGAQRGAILAALGPTVSASGYQVGPDVAAAMTNAFEDPSELLSPDGEGRWRLDLRAANARVLADAGVPEGNIHRSPLATGDEEFFSDRAVRPCGRMAAIAILPG